MFPSTADKVEVDKVTRSLDDITERWRKVKVELGSVQTMLEEMIQYWKRYNSCVDIFQVWLADAEKTLEKPASQRGVSQHVGHKCTY